MSKFTPPCHGAGRIALAVALSLTLLGGCKKPEPAPVEVRPQVSGEAIQFPADSTQVSLIVTDVVSRRERDRRVLSGRLAWNEDKTVRVLPAFGGRVSEILVKAGDSVKAGQALALLSSPDFGQVQSDAQTARTALNLARANLNRQQELFDQGVSARKDLESARAEFERARSEEERARERLKLYGKTTRVDQRLALTAPIAGVVVERNINPGQEVRPDGTLPNNATSLFTISDPTSLWAILDAQERDLIAIRVGSRLGVQVEALSHERFPGVVQRVADALDPSSRTIKVRAEIDNGDRRLKAEMFVLATIEFELAATVDVPAAAVFLEGDKHYAFVERAKGDYLRREVRIGAENDGRVVIVDGLKEGERVVTDGGLLLERILITNQGGRTTEPEDS